MNETIQQKIISFLNPSSEGISAADVRIGLGYTCVRLDNGNAGLAWTPHDNSGSCTHQQQAGTLAGSPASMLLDMLASPDNSLSRALGLATANALSAELPSPKNSTADSLELVNIQSSDKVVMVGFFGPLIQGIRKTGCRFDIVELDSSKPDTISPEEGKKVLSECTVAIITATSIINGTTDGLLASLGSPRAVIILGPSTFMCPEVFKGTPVTHLGGSRVRDVSAVLKIVSEGGGTMILKPYIDFETVCI
ncbi:MAG: DUF364 domain-containing protein [Spirochaetes bacterium]|nr:DUF364 domain-containing protein [Spirochaetota bacterium]